MANIFEINRVSNKITLGTTDTTINIASHTASKTLALDSSKNLISIQDLRTTATPLFAGIIIADGGTIGQSAGPLLTFDDTGNFLRITGCLGGIGDSLTVTNAIRTWNICDTIGVIRCLRVHPTAGAGLDLITRESADGIDTAHWHFATSATVPIGDLKFLDRLDGNVHRIRFKHGGGIALREIAAADADETAYGQIWVKNDAPNTLWFTDDTGVDHQIAYV